MGTGQVTVFVGEKFDLTVRRYDGTLTAHCHHRGQNSDGKSFHLNTRNAESFWERIVNHINTAHKVPEIESKN